MRVIADSHAIVWYVQGSERLSKTAATALRDAEASDGIVVSVVTIVDLWYVTQTTRAVTEHDLIALQATLVSSAAVDIKPIDIETVNAYTTIPRDQLADPWDRFIVATAMTEDCPLVSRDAAIHDASLVTTIW